MFLKKEAQLFVNTNQVLGNNLNRLDYNNQYNANQNKDKYDFRDIDNGIGNAANKILRNAVNESVDAND